ncbi:hypothetical protein HMPREF9554_02164 [Treponema phagedenis F0421]|nr:hypothetical protein HMPREF9554_02164 [Treponema phagedenis F0421]
MLIEALTAGLRIQHHYGKFTRRCQNSERARTPVVPNRIDVLKQSSL